VLMLEYLYTGLLPDLRVDVNSPSFELAVDLLGLADQYLLDHLKQMCERQLQNAVGDETAEALLQVAERANAWQLQQICRHHLRNQLAAAVADGETVIKDAQELRVKESDRIESSISWLRSAGINAEGTSDGMVIAGNEKINGGCFQSYDDHRLAMSLGIAGLISEQPITILDPDVAAISYPGFWRTIQDLGGMVG